MINQLNINIEAEKFNLLIFINKKNDFPQVDDAT